MYCGSMQHAHRVLRSVHYVTRARNRFHVTLTAERYNVERGQFSHVTATDLSVFRNVVGSDHVLINDEAEAFILIGCAL